jgi:Domain of unknown function DUF11
MLRRYFTPLLVACALTPALAGAPAQAFPATPGWEANSHSYPTNLPPGGSGVIAVDVYNTGSRTSAAGGVVTDTLPQELTAVSSQGWTCTAGVPSTCSHELTEITPETEDELLLEVNVAPQAAQGTVTNTLTVTGGGAPSSVSTSDLLTLSTAQATFGFPLADAWITNSDGSVDTQAGSHPYALTFNFDLNAEADNAPAGREEARNVSVNVPPGLIGNVRDFPSCSRQQFDAGNCPASTQIGIAPTGLGGNGTLAPVTFMFPVYNLTPPPGVPVQFGFAIFGIHALLDAGVRSGGDYGISEHIANVPQRSLVRSRVTLWGVPSDPSHDRERYGLSCTEGCASSASTTPLLTLPTSCAGPQQFSIQANTWRSLSTEAAYTFLSHDADDTPAGFTGCERLGFKPALALAPDTSQANAPAGLNVDVKMPQDGLTQTEGLAEADVRDATVTLPEGLVINPARAGGLQACQAAQSALGSEAAPSCPAAARIGSAQVTTPLLADKLEGGVYVLQSNPPDLRLLLAASGDGVNVKLVGEAHLDAGSGRIITTFAQTPQLPFTDLKLTLSGGAQGALTTPGSCGVYTTTSDFTPWSSPAAPDATPASSFALESGVGGVACEAPSSFAPSFAAGTANNQAGAFSPFSVTLSRQDSEPDLGAVQVTTPPGLLAQLKGVERCGEPQAAQGACGPGSLIGHAAVLAGAGPDPLYVQGGQVFLTGPYKGAPFGLSVVVPAVAGPFDLGDVVVRAAVGVDPHTAQITVVSDPLPRILDGVPLQLRTVNVTIDRQGFMFNPTSCDPLTVAGTIASTQGAQAQVASRFQAANCSGLAFKPSFTVSTQAKTSKKSGASLDVKVAYPSAGQANIRAVAVTLPKQLPARLTTIQQACPQATFAANPAGCPAGSAIGTGTAKTPILAAPLSGPAYLVSHGGAAFPDLVVVLQGEGVTLDLVGSIDIKKGVTSSTFASVPDAPVSSFELKLPEGSHSGLAAVVSAKAKGSLCGTSLAMPTTLTGQNGAVLKQSTKIAVTGCAKPKKKHKPAKKQGKGRHVKKVKGK